MEANTGVNNMNGAGQGDAGQAAQPQYSQGVQDLMSKKGWKSVDDIAKGYTEIEKFAGVPKERQFTWPKDDKDEEGFNALYNKLGRPEKPDAYEFKNETGIEVDETSYNEFKKLAHAEGLTTKQFNKLMNAHLQTFGDLDKKYKENSAAEFERCDKELKDKWKEQHSANLEKAIAMADNLKLKDLLVKKNLDNDPEVIEMLYNLSTMSDESGLPQGAPAGGVQNPQQELDSLLKDKAYTDASHPDHMKIMQKIWKLQGVDVTINGI
jgi:hypothetical protein